ncbi:helix-turn-helix transcriptional regulator [Amycolatopsis thermoflava]|uniref:helix-turn-helix transcriptional regulator n=1 Tax=Amycolatopsis thermoflava TaxID=84480 RepID=UPI0003FD9BBA|nr:helix-turn-helix domain-containing protein [Amycolatopsis thermoflava]
MTDDDLLTTTELAQMLRVSVNTIYAWNKRGTGPKRVRVGKYCRYPRKYVEIWKRSRTTQ